MSTDPQSPAIPPGWYRDHADPALQRWWDGTQWTERLQPMYLSGAVAAAIPQAPEGTRWSTPWIWLVLFLPLLGLLTLFSVDFRGYLEAILGNPARPDLSAAMGAMFNPAVIVTSVLSWVVLAAVIVFARLDYRELERRGVAKPFHWAWSFLSLTGYGIVYPIGRGVITHKRGAGGLLVVWLAGATYLTTYVVGAIAALVIMNQVLPLITELMERS